MTFSAAPPCAGPLSAAIAAATAACRLASVPATTRAVKAEALDEVGVHQRCGVVAGWLAVQHVQEVGGVAEVGVRFDRVAAVADVVVGCDQRRHLRGDAVAFAQGGLRRVVPDLWVEGGERGDGGAQHVHGVGVADAADDVDHAARHFASAAHLGFEACQLLRGRQFAVDEQVGGLFEGGVLGEVVDRVAAVLECARATIDVGGLRAVEVDAGQASVNLLLVVGHVTSPRACCEYMPSLAEEQVRSCPITSAAVCWLWRASLWAAVSSTVAVGPV